MKKTINVPHLEQYNGPFAMEETAFNAAVDYANRIDLTAHILAMKAKVDDGDGLDVDPDMMMTDDGIAVIDCVGTMTKYGSSLSDGVSTIALRQCIRQAANDPKCSGIMLRVDSPGGSADGTDELATDIANAGAKKPTWAYVDGMAASAAYWAASQAQCVVAAPAAMVGSIGTYGVMYDRSAQFAQNGVKAVVIRAGEQKGTGTPGTEITPGQIADRMRVVNELNDLFVAGVAKGRKMKPEDAKALNDGRVHVGVNAKAQRMVDQIGSMDDAMAGLRSAIKSKNQNSPAPARMVGALTKEIAMSDTPTAPATVQAASLKDLKAKFPKSNADWREKCLEDNLTLSAAGERWAEHLAAENAKLQEQLATARADVEAAKKPAAGTAPLTTGKKPADSPTVSGDPKAAIMEIVAEKIKAGIPREKAFAQACKENPELHQQWIASHTEQFGDKVKSGYRR